MPDKTAKHNGYTCVFTEADHSYRILETNDLLTSVTTKIKQFIPPFDSYAMAQSMIDKQKPAYIGMSVDEIIKQWRDKADKSAFEGTEIHGYLERWPVHGKWGFLPKTYRVHLMSKQVDKLFPKLLERFRIVETEKLILSMKMKVAGQVDMILADDQTKEGIILDWKSNSKITDTAGAFGNMLEPIAHLKNCDVVKYGLQLGIYEKILTDENYYPEFKGYRKSLIHVSESFGKVIKVENYKEEIECLISQ